MFSQIMIKLIENSDDEGGEVKQATSELLASWEKKFMAQIRGVFLLENQHAETKNPSISKSLKPLIEFLVQREDGFVVPGDKSGEITKLVKESPE